MAGLGFLGGDRCFVVVGTGQVTALNGRVHWLIAIATVATIATVAAIATALVIVFDNSVFAANRGDIDVGVGEVAIGGSGEHTSERQ